MKSRYLLSVGVAVLAAMVPVAAISVQPASGASHLKTVATFDRSLGQLPHGLAIDQAGNMYVSFAVNGQVMRIAPDGTQTILATLPTGSGYLTGVAVDEVGQVYVGAATFAESPAPGVFRIDPQTGALTRLLSLPKGAVPEGLAFRFGDLYVSDSAHGIIYRVHQNGTSERWLRDSLLAPDHAVGVTGLAWYGGSLYAAVADSGRIVQIPIVGPAGAAGEPVVYAHHMKLVGAAGIAFSEEGSAYVTTSKDRLIELSTDGTLEMVAHGPDGLASPTGMAWGTLRGMHHVCFIANTATNGGVPSIMKMRMDERGRHLP